MADTDKTPVTLLDELAALDPPHRREVAKARRRWPNPLQVYAMVGRPLTLLGHWPTRSTPTDGR